MSESYILSQLMAACIHCGDFDPAPDPGCLGVSIRRRGSCPKGLWRAFGLVKEQPSAAKSPEQLRAERLGICCSATTCRCICEWLIKGVGKYKDTTYCAHTRHGQPLMLYPALEDPNYQCPEGKFQL